jgi:hypothetical protein
MSDATGDVFPPDRIEGIEPIGKDQKKVVSPDAFKTYMQQPSPTPGQTGGVPSPFDLSRTDAHPIAGTPTVDSLLSQMSTTHSKMSDLNSRLNTPNLKLNHAQKYLLNNKLADAKAHINSAAAKVGLSPPPSKEIPTGSNPLAKFLAILSDGQYQLHAAQEQLQHMKMEGKTLDPGELLLMQVKLGKANNEIEYASILISKAVDTTKQLFNIQL